MIRFHRYIFILICCFAAYAGKTQVSGCNNTPSSGNNTTYTGSIFSNFGGVSGALNTKYSVSGSLGQLFIGDAFEKNYQTSLGLYTSFLLPPKPPIVTATQGDLLDRIQIRWEIDPLSPSASGGFNIYRDGIFMGNVGPSVKNFNDFNVIAGYPYTYTVRGINTFGEGYPGSALGFQQPNGVVTGWIQTPSGNPVIDAMVTLSPSKGFSAKFGPTDGAWVDTIGQNVPSLVPSGNQPWSLSFWVKTDSATNNAAIIKLEPSILEIRPLNSATGNDAIIVAVNTPNNLRATFPVATRKDWHHIVLTYDPELTRYRLYLDGVLEDLESGGLVIPAIGRIDFGEAINKTGTWEGSLDELRIYSRTLDILEINEIGHATASTLTPGLFRYWKMDEEEGTASFDLFKRNKLSFCGAVFDEDQAPVITSGKTNEEGYYRIESANYGTGTTFIAKADKNFYLHRALYLKSSQGDYINLPHFKMSRKMTFEFWANHDGPQPMDQTLLSKTWSGNELSIQLKQSGVDNRIFFKINNVTKDFGVVDPGYQHLAFTIDSLNGQVKFYRNGIQQGGNQTFGPVAGTWADSTTFLVGARWLNSNRVDFFNGLIDEVAMYDTTLTLSTIQSHFNASRVPTEKHLVQYYAMDEGSGGQLNNSGSILNGSGQHFGADWSSFAPNQVATPHDFTPTSRQVTLNPSVTSVDQVDFMDRSVVPVSGYVRFKNTDCFAPNVEILVNGSSYRPAIFTDSTGKFILDLDPGTTAVLTPKFEDHVFQPATWQVTNLVSPIAGLLFNDVTTRKISGMVAGGSCKKSIIRAPVGDPINQGTVCRVEVRSVDGCFARSIEIDNQEGDFEFLQLPPLEKITVAVTEHSDATIKRVFEVQGGLNVNLTQADTIIDLIYVAPPEVEISSGLDPVAGCSPEVIVLEQGDNATINIRVKEIYIATPTDNGVCYLDTANIKIVNGFADVILDTVMSGSNLEYSFQIGNPNPSPPFLKTLQVVGTTIPVGRVGSIVKQGIITGIQNKLNTFTTSMPMVPSVILRDPPGDGSSSFIETTQKVCKTTEFSLEAEAGVSVGADIEVVPTINFVVAPFGVGKVITVDPDYQANIEAQVTYKKVASNSIQTCVSFSNKIGTSDSDLIVGGERGGDLYMGEAINLIFGNADKVMFDPMTCTAAVSQIVIVQPGDFATTFIYSEFNIKNNVMRYLEKLAADPDADPLKVLEYQESLVRWQNMIDRNDSLKQVAKLIRNISFDAGTEYEYAETADTTNNNSDQNGINVESKIGTTIGIDLDGVGAKVKVNAIVKSSESWKTEEGIEKNLTTGYVLKDNDPGDAFTVDVAMDSVYKTPVFRLRAGQSSCPWEPGTANREGVNLQPGLNTGPIATNVPANEPAVFKMTLGNVSASNEDWTYGFTAVAGTNPHGAIIKVNGQVLNNNTIQYIIPYGTSVPITVTVERGPVEYDYNNLKIALVSECELARNLALSLPLDSDSLFFSDIDLTVKFIRPCSEVNINVPEQNWVVMNNDTLQPGTQRRITVSGYDLNSPEFQLIRVQYRSTDGNGAWINLPTPNGKYEAFNKNWSGFTVIPNSPDTLFLQPNFTQFLWETEGLPDGNYEIHAWAVCSGLAADKPGFSDIIKGRIDREPPSLIVTPQPSDGVYHVGDEISFTFNKHLNCTKLNPIEDVLLFDAETGDTIDITFTCFENKIIIDPIFANSFFENKILQAKLYNIEDKAGNTLDSTDWEFYVDRNELAWMSDSIGVTKYEENTAVITARIHNRGGYPVPFEISNVPPWARVVPDQGTLVANEIREISVYIDSSLTLGNWHDTLVMTTLPGINPFFMGGSENLPLGVRVICHAPEWYVNPASYSYSMNMTLQLNIENTLSTDVQDRVGAFINGQLAGVGRVQYNADLNKYLVFLTVYHNEAVGDTVTFQIWDASDCLIYGNIIEQFPYTVDELIGTPNIPQVLHTTGQVLNKIQLTQGWNWISYNVALDSSEVNPALSSLTNPQGGLIKSQTQFSLYSLLLQSWQGSLDTLSPFTMYQAKLGTRDSLSLIGGIVDPETPISLVTGWNWIGYLPQRGQNLTSALSSLSPSDGDIIKSQTAFAQYVNGFGWIGNLSFMSSPNGYLLKLANPDTLIYPPSSSLQGEPDLALFKKKDQITDVNGYINEVNQNRSPLWTVTPHKFEYNMNAIVVAEDLLGDILLETGDVIGVFAGDELRGVAEVAYIPQMGTHVCFLTMYANKEGEVLSFKIFDASKDIIYSAVELHRFVSNQILGSIENPYVLHLQNTTGVNELIESDALNVYPNPASNSIHIAMTTASDFNMPYTLTDMAGKKVYFGEEKMKAGENNIEIKVNPNWKTGPYVISCTTPEQVIYRMILIIK